jgi:enoyl-CoA hydratase
MSSKNLDFGEYIRFDTKKRFGIITLNRVHRSNAFTIEQLKFLKKAIEYCQNTKKIRGLILTAAGTSFSTGMDLDFIDGSDHAAVKELEETAAEICKLLFYGKPSIAAVNGRCMGEGVVFTLCCDYRIAVKDSYYTMPEIMSGIFPGTGCIILMVKQIGISWAKKMLMFSKKIESNNALKIGLIDEIVSKQEDLLILALGKAQSIFTKNQTVLNTIKLCSNHFLDKSFQKAYDIEKLGSAWFTFEDKDKYLIELKELVK